MADKISKSIFILIFILTIFSISASYVKFVVLKDFEIINDLEEEDYENSEGLEEESL